MVVGALAAVALVAVGATTVAVLKPWDSGDAPVRGLLAGSFPTRPTAAWTITPADIGAAADAAFFSPTFEEQQYRGPGAVVTAGAVIVAVPGSERSDVMLAGLDPVSGSVTWTTALQDFGGCANTDIEGSLACIGRAPGSADSDAAGSTVTFLDTGTGKNGSTYTAPFYVSAVFADGTDLYLSGRDPDADMSAMSKGTVEEPGSAWSRTYPDDRCSGLGSGDNNQFAVHGSIVVKGGGASVVASSADGSPLVDEVSSVVLLGDHGVMAMHCGPVLSSKPVSGDFVGTDGGVAFSSPSPVVNYDVSAFDDASAPVITRDGTALDPHDGEVLWSRAVGGDRPVSTSLIGDLVVFGTDSLTAVDASTGKPVWTSPDPSGGTMVASDGISLLSTTGDSLTATSLADGSELWRTTVDGDPEGVAELVSTDRGVLHASSRALSHFDWTGSAAALPRIEIVPANSEGGSGGTASDAYVTKCGTPPTFTPTRFTTDTGALVVTMRITASCPGGDVLSSAGTTISIRQGAINVASGVFDLSATPLAVPGSAGDSGTNGSVEYTFRYPAGSFWRLPDTLGTSEASGSTYVVDCVQSGSSAVQEMSPVESARDSVTATAPAPPATGDAEAAAFDALRYIADTDRPLIQRDLAERWIPQLSSKRPGLVADGTTWNNSSTLSEHLALRLRYPNVKLMWSGEWTVFSYDNFWVTGAGVTFPEAAGANAWCATNGLDAEHCFAKLISATHPVAGSTGLR